MSVLSAKKVRHLSLGVPAFDEVFPGFELGDFVVLYGRAASYVSCVLSVRCHLQPDNGGLGSSTIFVDGGNLFDPYLVAEIARSYGLDSRLVLKRIYVSRAFTAYQLSSLILEKLEVCLRRRRSKLLVISDVVSLFFDEDIPKIEADDLFTKICRKLAEIAARKKVIVAANYLSERRSRRSLFFETVLFGRSNVLVGFERKGRILSFILGNQSRTGCFSMDLPVADYVSLSNFMEV